MSEKEEQKGWREPFEGELPRDLTRTLQVIGAGLPRTGTISLTLALTWALHGDVCHGGSACLRGPECEFRALTETYTHLTDCSRCHQRVDQGLRPRQECVTAGN